MKIPYTKLNIMLVACGLLVSILALLFGTGWVNIQRADNKKIKPDIAEKQKEHLPEIIAPSGESIINMNGDTNNTNIGTRDITINVDDSSKIDMSGENGVKVGGDVKNSNIGTQDTTIHIDKSTTMTVGEWSFIKIDMNSAKNPSDMVTKKPFPLDVTNVILGTDWVKYDSNTGGFSTENSFLNPLFQSSPLDKKSTALFSNATTTFEVLSTTQADKNSSDYAPCVCPGQIEITLHKPPELEPAYVKFVAIVDKYNPLVAEPDAAISALSVVEQTTVGFDLFAKDDDYKISKTLNWSFLPVYSATADGDTYLLGEDIFVVLDTYHAKKISLRLDSKKKGWYRVQLWMHVIANKSAKTEFIEFEPKALFKESMWFVFYNE